MLIWSWVAALAAVFTFWIHTVLGHQTVHRPVQESNTNRFAKGTTAVCWHFTTVFLGSQAVALTGFSFLDISLVKPFLFVILFFNTTFCIIFMTVSKQIFGEMLKLPQPFLLGPIALFCGLALIHPARWPSTQLLPLTAAFILGLLAWIHILWARGSYWPAKEQDALIELVAGHPRGAQFPGKAATSAVAGLLLFAAGLLAIKSFFPAYTHLSWTSWAFAGVFSFRGLSGFLEPWIRPITRTLPYGFYNKVLYSPLCFIIAAMVLGVEFGS